MKFLLRMMQQLMKLSSSTRRTGIEIKWHDSDTGEDLTVVLHTEDGD